MQNQRTVIGMPRGFGKTTIAKLTVIWAAAFGHRKNIVIVGNTKNDSIEVLQDIEHSIMTNVFSDDFPEIAYPFSVIAQTPRAANSQLYYGRPVGSIMKPDMLVFPAIRGSVSSETQIRASGILVNTRGKTKATKSGYTRRPDFILVDDPQNNQSSRNVNTIDKLRQNIEQEILPSFDESKPNTFLMTCTVISPDDLADLMLSDPAYKTYRIKSVPSLPKNSNLWKQWYDWFLVSRDEAKKFYFDNREALHEGYEILDERFDSNVFENAYQRFMFEYFHNPDMFFSERQNEPQKVLSSADVIEDFEQNPVKEESAEKYYCGVDVQINRLYYVVAGLSKDARIIVKEFGIYPPQPLVDLPQGNYKTLQSVFGNKDARMKGILLLAEKMKKKGVERLFADRGWSEEQTIAAAANDEDSFVVPIKGDYKPERWNVPRNLGKRGSFYAYKSTKRSDVRTLFVNVNKIKTQLAEEINNNGMFIDQKNGIQTLLRHLKSERAKFVNKNGNKEIFWELREKGGQNHLLDCLTYAMCGLLFSEGLDKIGIEKNEDEVGPQKDSEDETAGHRRSD